MEYSQVILELLERIKSLENKVTALENKVDALEEKIENAPAPAPSPAPSPAPLPLQPAFNLEKVSAKYRALSQYLISSNEPRVTLTYSQIEEILGFPLPDNAIKFKHTYWANTETHSYASSWMAVGYKARVDTDSNAVTFIKISN